MSTDCERAISPPKGSELQHTLKLPANGMRTERNTPGGSISYEGRVSLISSSSNYGETLRTTFGLKSSNSQVSPSQNFSFLENQNRNVLPPVSLRSSGSDQPKFPEENLRPITMQSFSNASSVHSVSNNAVAAPNNVKNSVPNTVKSGTLKYNDPNLQNFMQGIQNNGNEVIDQECLEKKSHFEDEIAIKEENQDFTTNSEERIRNFLNLAKLQNEQILRFSSEQMPSFKNEQLPNIQNEQISKFQTEHILNFQNEQLSKLQNEQLSQLQNDPNSSNAYYRNISGIPKTSPIGQKNVFNLSPDRMTEQNLINGENSDSGESPYGFMDETGPNSVGSDQSEPKEIDPVTFMSASYDGNEDMFNDNLHNKNSKSLKCQFCSYSTDLKDQFTTHLNTHFVHKCMKCQLTTPTIEQLKEHLQKEHSMNAEDLGDLENTRIPKPISHGKIRTFRCKQCSYQTVKKDEFWSHGKTHIKFEKLLSCPKCQFVTEYKHHLEYHIRNHSGLKPFKCNKCNYSCVNKSMLNSHLKSHSNIYQYRCSNCTYATKYCHSLKLHLRKYGHTPTMVLNIDGTPNPVSIIDTYGSRRGPKLKKDENGMPIMPPQYQYQAQLYRAQMEVTGTIPLAPTVPLDKPGRNKYNASNIRMSIPSSSFSANTSPFPANPPPFPANSSPFPANPPPFPANSSPFPVNPFPLPPNFSSLPSFIPNEFKDNAKVKSEQKKENDKQGQNVENLNHSKSPEVEETFNCEICRFSTDSKNVLSHHSLLHQTKPKEMITVQNLESIYGRNCNVEEEDNQENSDEPSRINNFKPVNMKRKIAQSFSPTKNLQDYIFHGLNPLLYTQLINGYYPFLQQKLKLIYERTQSNEHQNNHDENLFQISPRRNNHNDAVLDLSKDQTPPSNIVPSETGEVNTSPSFFSASPPNFDISTPPSKSRRKGRAFKLERIAQRPTSPRDEIVENRSRFQQVNVALEPQLDSPMHGQDSEESAKNEEMSPPLNLVEPKIGMESERAGKRSENQCQYCDIDFKNAVMLRVHMGLHGYKHPFTCNMCGYESKDKLDFFLHTVCQKKTCNPKTAF